MDVPNKIVVIALGNPLRGDDGVGPAVCEKLAEQQFSHVDIVSSSGDAMNLIGLWDKCALAIVIDASVSDAEPGNIRRLESTGDLLEKEIARCSTHGFGVNEAIGLATALGKMPDKLVLYAIEAEAMDHGAPMSFAVKDAIDPVTEQISAEIYKFLKETENA